MTNLYLFNNLCLFNISLIDWVTVTSLFIIIYYCYLDFILMIDYLRANRWPSCNLL